MLIKTLFQTGARVSEFANLKVEDFFFDELMILIEKGKGGKSRYVPILPELAQELRTHLGDRQTGYLFKNPKTGKPITTIKTAWRKALRDAGIPHINFHCAGRHTFDTRAIDVGAPISAVKEVMGHLDITTTMRYVHATDEGKRRAVEAAAKNRVQSVPATNLPQGDEVGAG